MKHKIEINHTCEDNGDCDAGCWNCGDGIVVKVDNVEILNIEAWATCTSNSVVPKNAAILAILKHFGIDADIDIDILDDGW